MCYHNYTQYSGCNHYGEVLPDRYTPCDHAYKTILTNRGPSSPPIAPPTDFNLSGKTPKRSDTLFARKNGARRFFSGTVLRRANTTDGRRTVSSPESRGRSSTSSFAGEAAATGNRIPDHELLPIVQKCPNLKLQTVVGNGDGNRVCKECKRWIENMRNMIIGYDKGRGVRGNIAFQEFLEMRQECREVAEMLGFGSSRDPVSSRGITRWDSDELYRMP